MSMDPGTWDLDDPGFKLASKSGGGRGVAGSGPGPGGGFVSYAGGYPGLSSGGYDYGDTPGGNPRAALLKRIMAAIMAAQQPPVDNVPADLQSGEYVLNAPATALVGPENLDRINAAGNGVRKGYFNGGKVMDVASTASTAAGHPEVAALMQAVKFVGSLFGGKDGGGPNGLDRARAMGYGPEGYAYGGYVRSPYGRSVRTGGYAPAGYQRQPAAPQAPAPTTPPPTTTGGSAPGTTLPTTAIDELLKKYGQAGAFDPGYGMGELEAALARQNQGAQRADVTDLMASGLDDPSLYASQLLASRGQRSKDASQALASARLGQVQSAQEWIRSLLGGRKQDQIAELLARIK